MAMGFLDFFRVQRGEPIPTGSDNSAGSNNSWDAVTGGDAAADPGRVSASAQPPSGSREERLAHNEDWCRDLNERKAEWMKDGHLTAGFRCECWKVECGDRIRLSGSDWQKVRSRGTCFAVAPGHIAPEAEAVIEEHPHFWLVEKTGEAGEAAEELA
jgi:hypothetical protein